MKNQNTYDIFHASIGGLIEVANPGDIWDSSDPGSIESIRCVSELESSWEQYLLYQSDRTFYVKLITRLSLLREEVANLAYDTFDICTIGTWLF